MVKPFSLEELKARIGRLLPRDAAAGVIESAATSPAGTSGMPSSGTAALIVVR